MGRGYKPTGRPNGRPTKYKGQETCDAAYLHCKSKAATDLELAAHLGIDESTLNEWKKLYPDFSLSIKKGKEEVDEKVERSLFERATGYSHKAVKMFQHEGQIIKEEYTERFPPDATSMIFWLKNRQRDRWRDKQDVEHSGNVNWTAVIKDKE